MPPLDQFKFLSRDAFSKLNRQQREAYLRELTRYIAGLNADLDEYERKNDSQDQTH